MNPWHLILCLWAGGITIAFLLLIGTVVYDLWDDITRGRHE